MNESVKLCITFLTDIKKFPTTDKGVVQAPETYKDVVWKSFEKLLASGVTADEMNAWMNRYKSTHPTPTDAYTIEDIINYLKVDVQKRKPIVRKHNPDNLLEAGRFYYHPALQIAPPPPVINVNPDGTFTASYEEEEFYLEIKEEFTLEDLVKHFHKLIPTTRKRKNIEADKGAFKFLLKSYDLDVILYCIDEARVADDLPSTIFEIEDHVENAELILEDRKNTLFEVGLDHVIPR